MGRIKFKILIGVFILFVMILSVGVFMNSAQALVQGIEITSHSVKTANNLVNIVWSTNVTGTSWVFYGKTAVYEMPTKHDMIPKYSTEHDVLLTGLEPGTKYYFKLSSTDEEVTGTKAEQSGSFTTTSTVPDQIIFYDVKAVNTSMRDGMAVITYETNVPINNYGLNWKEVDSDEEHFNYKGGVYSTMRKEHKVQMGDNENWKLTPGATYRYRVCGYISEAKNAAYSEEREFVYKTYAQVDSASPVDSVVSPSNAKIKYINPTFGKVGTTITIYGENLEDDCPGLGTRECQLAVRIGSCEIDWELSKNQIDGVWNNEKISFEVPSKNCSGQVRVYRNRIMNWGESTAYNQEYEIVGPFFKIIEGVGIDTGSVTPPVPSVSPEEQILIDRIKRLQIQVSELEKQVVEFERKMVLVIDKPLQSQVAGKILLQVEEHGEAWYVEPITGKKYYLKDGQSAYNALKVFGLGVSNVDLEKIPVGIEERSEIKDSDGDGLDDKLEEGLGTDPNNSDSDNDGYNDMEEIINNYDPLGPSKKQYDMNLGQRLKGKILLQVEKDGQAWYLNPKDGKRYYMKDGIHAYQIMRYLSLGITNDDIRKIPVGDLGFNN